MNRHIHSFKLAFGGIFFAFRTQLNFTVHSLAALLAIFLAVFLKISNVEWVVIILTIIMVFSAEMINTALESMTNLITTEHRQTAKIAKDVSAGMVLTTAIGSIIIAAFIFLPKIFTN